MMSLLLLLVLFCGNMHYSVFGRLTGQTQRGVPTSRGKKRNVSQRVRLTTSVLGQQYCTQIVDAENRYAKLRLTLKLHLINVSNENIIIPKYGATKYSVVLSRSLAQAQVKHYSYESHSVLGQFQLAQPEFSELEPSDLFHILQPDKSYEYEYSQQIDIDLSDLGDPKLRSRSGDYFLQITIQTWSGETERAKQLQQRWSKYGYFWYYDVISEPMVLRIKKPPSITAMCR